MKRNPEPLEDGTLVVADVLNEADDADEAVLAADIRMLSVRGSPVDDVLRTKRKNDVLQVLGVPRISLALVQERLEQGRTEPEILSENLPYEMILVGVYPSARDVVPPVVWNGRDKDRATGAKLPSEPRDAGPTDGGQPPFGRRGSDSSARDVSFEASLANVFHGFSWAVGVALLPLTTWLLWRWPVSPSLAWRRRRLEFREVEQLLRWRLPERKRPVVHYRPILPRLFVPLWYLWRLLLAILLFERRRRLALQADVISLAEEVRTLDRDNVIEKPAEVVELIQKVSPRAAVLQAAALIEGALLRLAPSPFSIGDAITNLTITHVLDTYTTGAYKILAGLRDGAQFFHYKPSRRDALRFLYLTMLVLQLLLEQHHQRNPILVQT